MTDFNTIRKKSDKHFYFDVALNWVTGSIGMIHSRDVNGTIYVATPKQFGGEGEHWSPEHLFLSSICSCYMSTYLNISKKMNFDITRLECSAIGQVELVDNKYKFTNINLYPKIAVAEESLLAKARIVVEKTQKYCLISNSIDAKILYHSEVLIAPQAVRSEDLVA